MLRIRSGMVYGFCMPGQPASFTNQFQMNLDNVAGQVSLKFLMDDQYPKILKTMDLWKQGRKEECSRLVAEINKAAFDKGWKDIENKGRNYTQVLADGLQELEQISPTA